MAVGRRRWGWGTGLRGFAPDEHPSIAQREQIERVIPSDLLRRYSDDNIWIAKVDQQTPETSTRKEAQSPPHFVTSARPCVAMVSSTSTSWAVQRVSWMRRVGRGDTIPRGGIVPGTATAISVSNIRGPHLFLTLEALCERVLHHRAHRVPDKGRHIKKCKCAGLAVPGMHLKYTSSIGRGHNRSRNSQQSKQTEVYGGIEGRHGRRQRNRGTQHR